MIWDALYVHLNYALYGSNEICLKFKNEVLSTILSIVQISLKNVNFNIDYSTIARICE